MSYKVLAHDDHAFHIQHKDGTQFSIAKKGLSKATTEKIQALYGGGEVQPGPASLAPSLDNLGGLTDALGYATHDVGNWLMSPAGGSAPAPTAPQEDVKPSPQPASYDPSAAVAQPAEKPASPDQPQDPMADVPGLKDMADAYKGIASAKSSGENDVSNALTDAKQQRAMANLKYDDQMDSAKAAQEVAEENYKNFQMRPNRVWSDMKNGQKATAVIGLILGGIGSGLTHQPNAALSVLDKAIDDDVNAQKDELGKRHNLLTEALQRTKDIGAAEAETRLTINSSLQTQIQAAMARTQSQEARLNGQIAIAKLKMEAPQLASQLLEYKMRQKMVQGQELPPQAMELLPKDVRERAVTVQGEHGPKIALAPTADAKKEYDKVSFTMKSMNSKFDDALKFMSTKGTQINPWSENSGEAETLYHDMILEAGKVGDLARFTPEEKKDYIKMIPHPGQALTDRGIAQLQKLKQITNDKLNAAAGTYLENYNPGKFQMGAPVRK